MTKSESHWSENPTAETKQLFDKLLPTCLQIVEKIHHGEHKKFSMLASWAVELASELMDARAEIFPTKKEE